MNIADIVEKWLIDNKYDGLFSDCCGCKIGDLMPCGEPGNCEVGYKVPCPGSEDCPADGDCLWHIGPTKHIEVHNEQS